MPNVITVENLGKKYLLSHQAKQDPYVALRDVLSNGVKKLGQRMLHPFEASSLASRRSPDEFWALKDVFFEVKQGDRIGIVGRNGAGKSTLLKILSRITEPTTGSVRIKGRVASLLEVGTGFHPELTGRENIFLNGAILGMSRAEIRKKFDAIVDFAEVERFLDMPVKRYSSGMYVRLAFAVAAHLEPEILIVDEVLAVGDAQFQKKCLGKMEDVSAKEGRTVLFVSHNMAAVQKLCRRAVWLEGGLVAQEGYSRDIVTNYLKKGSESSTCSVWNDQTSWDANEKAKLKTVRVLDSEHQVADIIDISSPVIIEIEYAVYQHDTVLNLSISLFNEEDNYVFASPSMSDPNWYLKKHPVGLFRSKCVVPSDLLNQGRYSLTVLVVEDGGHIIGQEERAVSIDMVDSGSKRGNFFGTWGGIVRPSLDWSTEYVPDNYAVKSRR